MAGFGDLGHPGEGDLAGTPGIGIIGAGWIVRECHLPAYLSAGAEVKGVTSRTPARSEGLAEASGIAAFDDWEASSTIPRSRSSTSPIRPTSSSG